VVAAPLVEPVIAAVLGTFGGAALAVASGLVLAEVGLVATGVSAIGLMLGMAIAIGVSIVAALLTSIVPTWNAASRPPIRSLTAGG
jgi:hypothetical protein